MFFFVCGRRGCDNVVDMVEGEFIVGLALFFFNAFVRLSERRLSCSCFVQVAGSGFLRGGGVIIYLDAWGFFYSRGG